MMLFGYACAVGIAVLFMLYLDGEIGVMMLAFLLLMPILSLGVTLWVKRTLRISVEMPESVAKHRAFPVKIVMEKKSRLPMPFLRMKMVADRHFAPLNPAAEELADAPVQQGSGVFSYLKYQKAYKAWRKSLFTQLTPDMLPICLSMGTERKKVLELSLEGDLCGTGTLTLSEGKISDFLRMFRFSYKQEVKGKTLLLPEIPQLKVSNELFRTVSDEVMTADEECDVTPTYSASSTAGYEHRDYVPGDSLKRINWKLSTKKHRLMVRMDEPVALAKLSVVLDFHRPENPPAPKILYTLEQQLTETALGLLMLCMKQGFPCVLHFQDENGTWVAMSLDTPEQLAVEAVTLLRGGFRSSAELAGCEPVPPAVQRDGGSTVLWFASHCSPAASAAVSSLQASSVYFVLPKRTDAAEKTAGLPSRAQIWYATEENNLEKK